MRDALSSAHCDHGAERDGFATERDGFATARDDQAEPRRDHGAERDGFAAVRVEGLVCRYGRETVFRDVSFAIWPGDFAVIIGANGAGKSTLLKIVLGEMTPDAGSVNVFGMTPRARGARALAVAHPLRQRGEVGRRGADSRARAHACPRPSPAAGDSLHEKNEGNRCREVRIGYLSQHGMSGGGAFPATGWEVVLSSMYADIGPVLPARARHRARAREALALVGAEEWAKKPLEELSGGQLQRIMVARALAPSPDLLLLDEPTTGVDQETSAAIIGLLARLSRDSGMTTAMVTHDVASVAASATRVFCLEHGTLVELGKSQVESELTHKHKHPMRQAATVKTDARELMRGS